MVFELVWPELIQVNQAILTLHADEVLEHANNALALKL